MKRTPLLFLLGKDDRHLIERTMRRYDAAAAQRVVFIVREP